MNTIQSGMLVALGFLAAMLLVLLTAPAFWSRAVRLTARRLKETVPLSEMEIMADRDRIRAEYAIKMHKLETLVEQVKMAAARQQIDINRRDARVNTLEGELERLRAAYEEAQNARRVLEQTVADRLPRVEGRLTDAKQLLHAREREIDELVRTGERQTRALAEASSINAQQQAELERLGTSLAERIAKSSAGGSDGESALRSELEALRAKTREQAQLLARMQSLAGRPTALAAAGPAQVGAAADGSSEQGAQPAPLEVAQADLERQLRTAKARNEDQAGEIARLKAAIAVFEREADSGGRGSIRESRIALKARVQALEAQSTQQADTIQKLRNELVTANERLARQAAHFTGELRRLGSGGSRARQPGAASVPPARTSLVDRVALARNSRNGPQSDASDADRDVEVLMAAGESGGPAEAAGAVGEFEGSRRSMAVNGDAEAFEAPPNGASVQREAEPSASSGPAASPHGEASEVAGAAPAAARGRPRLLDRIAGLARTP